MPYIPTGRPPGRPRRLVLKGEEESVPNYRPGYTIVIQRPNLVILSSTGLSVASVARVYGVPDSTMRTFLKASGCDSIFRPVEDEGSGSEGSA